MTEPRLFRTRPAHHDDVFLASCEACGLPFAWTAREVYGGMGTATYRCEGCGATFGLREVALHRHTAGRADALLELHEALGGDDDSPPGGPRA